MSRDSSRSKNKAKRHSASRSRSRSRDRSHSHSKRSRSGRHSSGSKSRRRRSRSRSRDRRRSRSRSRDRRRSRSHSRHRRSHSKDSSSRSHSRSRRHSDEETKAAKEDSSQTATTTETSEPDLKKMTPAERLRAKMKMMLEKNTASAKQSHDLSRDHPPQAPPTAEALASIESDAFVPTDFTSHRTVARIREKLQQSSEKPTPGGVAPETHRKRDHVMGVASSEYEPQIVELPIIVEKLQEQREPAGGCHDNSSEVAKSKNEKWLQKLQKMRQSFRTPPTDL